MADDLQFVNSPPPAAITAGATAICTGQSTLLQANNSTATYNWLLNGTPIAGAFLRNYTATQSGIYSVVETSPNGCDTLSNSITVTVNNYPAPVISSSGIPYTCTGGTVTLTTADTAGYTYQWQLNSMDITGATDTSYTATAGGSYNVIVTNAGICSTPSAPVVINPAPETPSICLVTVDDSSTHNVIYLEKPITTTIDSFQIYREVTTNVYSHIASVAYDSLSEYHDFGANPNVTSYRYKLAVKDICGQVSSKSDYHSTIHLQTLGNGNMQWTLYEIENATNPVTFYRCYRDNAGTGNFLPLSVSVPGNNSTWTDVAFANFPNADYKIDVNWNIACTPTRSSISTTHSNIKHNATAAGISESAIAGTITIAPNPFSSVTTITFSEIQNFTTIKIRDVVGQEIINAELILKNEKSATIDMSSYAKGVYFVTIEDENKNIANRKIVVN